MIVAVVPGLSVPLLGLMASQWSLLLPIVADQSLVSPQFTRETVCGGGLLLPSTPVNDRFVELILAQAALTVNVTLTAWVVLLCVPMNVIVVLYVPAFRLAAETVTVT